ncbi:MAG: diguanylate cyclase [Ilumatobacter sp.]
MSRTHGTLRVRWVAFALVALVVVQAFAAVLSGIWARNTSIAVAQDSIAREGATTVESILRHLEPAEQSIEVTTRLLDGDLLDVSPGGLERYLYAQLAVMPQIAGAFVGYPDGSFVFVATEDEGYRSKRITTFGERSVEVRTYDADFALTSTTQVFDDDFDPRARPWYEAAVESGELSWTDPYVFFSSQEPGVTASKAIADGDEIRAVVGLDVELSGLALFLDNLAVADAGEAFVLSGDSIIGAPSEYAARTQVDDEGELELLGASELGLARAVQQSSTSVATERVDGSLVLVRAFPDDQGLAWRLVIRAPESSFTGAVVDQQQLTLLATFSAVTVFALVLGLLWRARRPIQELQMRAGTDPLTRLANRRAVSEAGAELRRRMRDSEVLSVVVLDVDGLKQLNDSVGHESGDRLIVTVAEALHESTREGDIAGRLGGDEFVVVQPMPTPTEAVVNARRLQRELDEAVRRAFPAAVVGVTGGLTIGDAGSDLQTLINEADQALISAKAQARGMLRVSERAVNAAMNDKAGSAEVASEL